jgi:RNase P subunit RPR2
VTAKVENIDLPQGVRLDPRRGPYGGQYVIVTCPVCGEERRYRASTYLSRQEYGREPKSCSRACGQMWRRYKEAIIKSEICGPNLGAALRKYISEVDTGVEDPELPPGVRLDRTRRGRLGARYVFVTCQVCGREFRLRLSNYNARVRRGQAPKTCSRRCAAMFCNVKKHEMGITQEMRL